MFYLKSWDFENNLSLHLKKGQDSDDDLSEETNEGSDNRSSKNLPDLTTEKHLIQQSFGHNEVIDNLTTSVKSQENTFTFTHSSREKLTKTTNGESTKDVGLGSKTQTSDINGTYSSLKTAIAETQSTSDIQDVPMTVTSRTKTTDIWSSIKGQTRLALSTSMGSHSFSSISTQFRHTDTLNNVEIQHYPETGQAVNSGAKDNGFIDTSETKRRDSSHFVFITGGCAAVAFVLVLAIAVAVCRFKTSKDIMFV